MERHYSAMELAELIDTNYTQNLCIPNIYTAYTSFLHRSRNEARSNLNIFIQASQDIEKYANDKKYPFIIVEYDYTLHIDKTSAPKAYNKCLAENSYKFNCKAQINKPLVGKIYDERYLNLGDKNWLTAEHSIKIEIPVPYREYYTQQEVIGIVELLRKTIVIH